MGQKQLISNLTIPGLLKFNNTTITCYVSGIVTSVGFIEKTIDTILRIQGKLYNK